MHPFSQEAESIISTARLIPLCPSVRIIGTPISFYFPDLENRVPKPSESKPADAAKEETAAPPRAGQKLDLCPLPASESSPSLTARFRVAVGSLGKALRRFTQVLASTRTNSTKEALTSTTSPIHSHVN